MASLLTGLLIRTGLAVGLTDVDHALAHEAPPRTLSLPLSDKDRTQNGQNPTRVMEGLSITPTPDDTAKGWTVRMMAAARGMYRRGDRAPIVVEGNRRYENARRRARRAAAIYAKPLPVDLDEVVRLLWCRETLEMVALRMGVREDSIITATRRKGTPDQRERIMRASEDMKEIRLGLAS